MSSSGIVVGVDGSPSSLRALHWAVQQARSGGDRVTAVAAWRPPLAYGGYPLIADEDWSANARETLDSALDQAFPDGPPADVTVERRVQEGHPATVLLDAARDARLLVVGSRGHGGFAGMLLGSVSQHVAAHSPCPVVVVRDAGADEADAAAALSAGR